jgi:hypothetical protein
MFLAAFVLLRPCERHVLSLRSRPPHDSLLRKEILRGARKGSQLFSSAGSRTHHATVGMLNADCAFSNLAHAIPVVPIPGD